MALINREVGILAATTVALSPRVRRVARQGAVYGLAGALKAGDVVMSTARGAVRGAQAGVSGEDGASAPTARPTQTDATREPS